MPVENISNLSKQDSLYEEKRLSSGMYYAMLRRSRGYSNVSAVYPEDPVLTPPPPEHRGDVKKAEDTSGRCSRRIVKNHAWKKIDKADSVALLTRIQNRLSRTFRIDE